MVMLGIVLAVVKRSSTVVEEVVVEMGCGGPNAAAEGVDSDLAFIHDSSSIHGAVCAEGVVRCSW